MSKLPSRLLGHHRAGDDLRLDVGMALDERRQPRNQPAHRERRPHVDPHRARRALRLQRLGGRVDLRQRRAGLGEELLALRRQRDLPDAPLEQRDAQAFFKALDLPAHRAVRDVKLLTPRA
jgi:hypothetical protein